MLSDIVVLSDRGWRQESGVWPSVLDGVDIIASDEVAVLTSSHVVMVVAESAEIRDSWSFVSIGSSSEETLHQLTWDAHMLLDRECADIILEVHLVW